MFSIDQFDFINLSRPPSVEKTRLVRELRPGSRGVTFWDVGTFAMPFTVTSVRDCGDTNDAQSIFIAYQTLVGLGPVTLWWAGVSYPFVIVHDVDVLDGGMHATLAAIGGRLGNSRALLRCVWTLEYVPTQG